jgi:UDP-N-acetylmuramyl-tripeptide synthetase
MADMAGLAWLLPEDFSEASWRLPHALLGFPTRKLKIIGVTGTNGKTTTAWLLRSMLDSLGEQSAYIGTLGYQDGLGALPLENTTPIAPELALLLSTAVGRGCTAIAMEVSSHALDQKRVDGVEFDAAIFTNLTQDHLDYHGTMDAYGEAKFRLFGHPWSQVKGNGRAKAAINRDDPTGLAWLARVPSAIAFSQSDGGANGLTGVATHIGLSSLELELTFRGESFGPVRVPLGGNFNVENSLAAVAGCLTLGFPLSSVAKALSTVTPVPGRFEPVAARQDVEVIVDYAHTPDALEKLLGSVRPLARGRVITVFGCGGDRDRTKRPKMARAASSLSDVVVVTSDNPRTEDPAAILAEVATGVVSGVESHQILERPAAIDFAVELAQAGDVVVIAGKGHEDYQIIGHQKFPMDDRDLARKALERRSLLHSIAAGDQL